MKPTAIDLCCGLGGWTEGLLAEGWHVIGYDIERHDYGTGGYPGEFILADITTLHGSQFKDASLLVASPPCQRYSYMAMPWSLAKAQATMIDVDSTGEEKRKLNLLFDTCFRLQREASEAAGRYIPMIVENVRGAQRWVGRAPYHYGSFYLWGDIPALMPTVQSAAVKTAGRSMSRDAANKWGTHNMGAGEEIMAELSGLKVPGIKLSEVGFNVAAAQRYREGLKHDGSGWMEKGSLASHNRLVSNRVDESGIKGGGDWFGSGDDCSLQRRFSGTKQAGISGPRSNGKGDKWFQDGAAAHGSRSNSRKAASAMIAKIPFPLSQYIAHHFHPERYTP